MSASSVHPVLGGAIDRAPIDGEQLAFFALGCFWGAEKAFWKATGVVSTAVGYMAGDTKNPSYREVCSGQSGHTEAVRVIFDANRISYEELLKLFFESHDPTQGNRQGNDVGTQYRSGIYTTSKSQEEAAKRAALNYGKSLSAAGLGPITSEIVEAPDFYFAEEYHQQYLHKNPQGYCGLGGCGVKFPSASE